jgi:hypothetical protein
MIESLSQVRKVVTHDNCMDGLASAMLLREALPSAEITFCGYGADHEALEPEPGLLFCDFTPPRARVDAFVTAGALVLDHHVHARDIVECFGDHGVFADSPGVSGAVLAFEHVWLPALRRGASGPWDDHSIALQRQLFAELVGVRDTWRKEDPRWREALELHAVLEAFPREHWLASNGIRNALEALDTGIGAALVARKAKTVEQLVATGLIRRVVGSGILGQQGAVDHAVKPRVTWALSAAPSEFVSDLGEASREAGVDVLVNVQSIVRAGALWHTVSLRSNETCDVGAIAKRYGGGGHMRAAGFQIPQDLSALALFSWISTHASL